MLLFLVYYLVINRFFNMGKIEPVKIDKIISLSSGISVRTDLVPKTDKCADVFFDESDAKILRDAGRKGVFAGALNETSE